MKTARRMGIATVAVYSEADRERAACEASADEAIYIGPIAFQRKVLSFKVENLISRLSHEAAAEAVHPGYGFLSENAEFARAVKRAGAASPSSGPRPNAIKLDGR